MPVTSLLTLSVTSLLESIEKAATSIWLPWPKSTDKLRFAASKVFSVLVPCSKDSSCEEV